MTPIKATIFILGSDNSAYELSDFMRELFKNAIKAKFGLRSDSEIILVDDNNPDLISINDYHKQTKELAHDFYSIIAIKNPVIKKELVKQIKKPILSFIHPKSTNLGKVGAGCIIHPNVVLCPQSILDEYVLCESNTTIGYNSHIKSFVTIGSNVSIGENVNIGEGSIIGAGSIIYSGVKIKSNSFISPGSVISKDIS